MKRRNIRSTRNLIVIASAAVAAVAVSVGLGLGIASPRQRSTVTGSDGTVSSGSGPQRAVAPSGAASPSGDPSAGTAARGSASELIPPSGAYLGAYVQPAEYTATAEVTAVQEFQRAVGGSLGLVHVYHRWNDPFPSMADRHFISGGKVLLLTWAGTPDTKEIIAGRYDAMIRARAEAVLRLHRPILLEFRHEMDRPNLQWVMHGPADYIKAWDHIRAIFAQVGARNVGWVWCPTGYGFQVGRAQAYYPGNSEVDWVCADVYSYSPAQSLQQAAGPFLSWAAHTRKPVIIGEFGVDGPASAWPGWLMQAGRFVEQDPQIKAMAYFDANGTDSNGRPFRSGLGSNSLAVRSFAQLLSWPVFRPALPSAP